MMNVRIIVFKFVIVAIFHEKCAFIFHSKISGLVKTAKEYYKLKYHKDKTWHFLGYDRSEYPGTDQQLLNLNKDKWNMYYGCLQQQEESLSNHGSIIPEAALAFQGHLITFACKVCLSPSEVDNMESVEWYFGAEDSEKLLPVDITEHVLVSPEDKMLHLYNLDLEQTGQYVCQLNGQLTAPYFLTVASETEPLRSVHQMNQTAGPAVPWVLAMQGLVLDTFWGEWSPCSRCNVVGKRHKLGYCILGLASHLLDKNENGLDNNTLSLNQNFSVSSEEIEILRVFKYGMPCRSHILPHVYKGIAQVSSRPSELASAFCKVPCPTGQLFVVKNKDGKILETANNSAGIYSMLQGIPKSEPNVERTLQYEETDSTITLTCPGNRNKDTPIQWQIGSRKVVPSVLSKESQGRIYISITEKIIIKEARVSDSDVYSCWQDKELAGAVKVIIEKSFKLHFNHHMMLFGIVVIILTFMYVFVRAYSQRKNVKS